MEILPQGGSLTESFLNPGFIPAENHTEIYPFCVIMIQKRFFRYFFRNGFVKNNKGGIVNHIFISDGDENEY